MESGSVDTAPTRNLALDLVRVTEAAALSAARFMGRGDKNAADHAAVEGMRMILNLVEMDGVIVIGEGEKDHAPMLYNGEHLGTGRPPLLDIAVDPIDGTRPLAHGQGNSIATVALAPRGSMFNPGPAFYMNKIAVGPLAKDAIDIDAPVKTNLENIARAIDQNVKDLTVVILDRERHKDLISAVRLCGARIRLIPDGDVAGALMAAIPESGIDVLMGTGGSPEGVLAACAMRCLGGNIQCKLSARNDEEKRRMAEYGYSLDKVLMLEDLVSSEDVFFAATGITTGDLLRGVDYKPHAAVTDSLVMRGLTGTVRRIIATHRLDKLDRISSIIY
jgi:fructose-1,6-bisphosphatase II